MSAASETLPMPRLVLPAPAAEAAAPPAAEATAPPTKRRRAPLVLAGLLLVAAAVAVYLYVSRLGKETTDDAQVESHVANVAARTAGRVARVLVQDNQHVAVGDVLVELDARDAQARLSATRADLAAATAALHAAETQLALTEKTATANLAVARGGIAQARAVSGTTGASIAQAEADLVAARSRRALAATELARSERLLEAEAVAEAEVDNRRSTLEQADAAVDQAEARLRTAEAGRANASGTVAAANGRLIAAESGPEQIEAARAQVEVATAKVAQAQAAVDQAQIAFDETKVRAEVAGVVTRRTIEPGQMVGPDRPLMAIVDDAQPWIVANFKETQLAGMQEGQRVKVELDAYDTPLWGRVESLAPGTGSRFALLPPDNASGNFTKVTQRVPVKIVLDDLHGLRLRPGLSAEVTVYTK